jgi:D-3-phosphoglycerate dehydrogenase / 2-oxoglutarate reductase
MTRPSRRSEVALAADGSTVVIWDPRNDGIWTYDIETELLAAHGVGLVVPEGDHADAADLASADVLIVASPLPNSTFETMPRCIGIVCYSAGMDTVDIDAAGAAGIEVTSAAGYCTDEVSDHAMALLLALQRRLLEFATLATNGDWSPYFATGSLGIRRVRGQTMGIVGAGRIGSAVATKAGAFGMNVLAYDPFLTAHPLPFVTLVDLPQLLAESDAVVLCSALTEQARHLIGADALAQMKDGAVLVNVARGAIVDEAAIAVALDSGRLAGVGLDVREQEPPDPARDRLRARPNAVLTQHLGATSAQSHYDLHMIAARRCVELLTSAGRIAQKENES